MAATGCLIRRLYFCTAVLAALVVLVGFARTFYLRIWFDVPPLSALRYLHGLLMTIWYALFLAQVMLVFRRRIDIHRRLGIVAALTAAALVPVGSATAIAFMRQLHMIPTRHRLQPSLQVMTLFFSLFVFALLVSTALVLRRHSDVHKRLMMLASLSLLGPALARVFSDEQAVWLTYALVLTPMIDTWRHRRLHPAFGWGGALFLLSSRLALHVATSKP